MKLKQKIDQFIKNKNVCVIATCSENNPRASTVNYVSDRFMLYVVTSSKSTKCKNIKENPNVSVAIDDQGRRERACLQAEGIAEILEGTQAEQAKKFYSQKRDLSRHELQLIDAVLKVSLRKMMFSVYMKEGLKVYRVEV